MDAREIERGLEAHERRLNRVEENLVVQGEMLSRVDQRLDRIAAMQERQQEELRELQSAMLALFLRMDRFLQGLDRGDGNPPG